MAASTAQAREALVRPVEESPALGRHYSAQATKKSFISQTNQCEMATVVIAVTVAGCVACFFYYPYALFILLPVGMILSCTVPYWLIPTYLCFIMLILYLVICLYHHSRLVVTVF